MSELHDLCEATGLTETELRKLTPAELAYMIWQAKWTSTARPEQIPPEDGWTEIGYQAGRGYGKGLALDTPIPTPDGWVLNGNLRDGDTIFDENMHPTTVLKAHEPYLPIDMYSIGFDWHHGIEADGDHLWATIGSAKEAFGNSGRWEEGKNWASRAVVCDTRSLAKGRMIFKSWLTGFATLTGITNKTKIPVKPVRCITVDSPSRLYLAGEGMVPTHNTRVGAEWLGRSAWEDPSHLPSCVVAPTFGDIRFTAFEGVSGLCNIIPPECIKRYNSSDSIMELMNGAIIRGFSAEKPERLRGPEHCRAWFDEIAAWGPTGGDVWKMAKFGLRIGTNPQILWTSTPKPVPLVREITAPKKGRIIVRGSTYDNRANLVDSFYDEIAQYEGTTLGRQEIEGEIIDPEEAGIIKRNWFRLWPADKPLPAFQVIIMSLDTAFTEKTNDVKSDPDPSACGVFGTFMHEHVKQLMLLDCWSDHLGFPELLAKVEHEAKTRYGDDIEKSKIKPLIGSDKMLTSGRKADIILIEDKGSGISLRQTLATKKIMAQPYNPGNADKLTRLHLVSPLAVKKRIWLPESALHKGKPRNWTEPFLAQVCSFTGEGSIKHDDFVDVFTQCARLCMDKGFVDLTDVDIVGGVRQDSKGREPSDKRPERRTNPYST